MQYPHYPYGGPPRPPLPPPRPGLSPLVITLIVIGGALALGGGACVFCGALAVIGADDADHHDDGGTAQATPTAQPTSAPSPPPAAADEDDDEAAPGPAATATATATAAPTAKGNAVTPIWFCNATGYVRVCGFANVCNNINVFGSGTGTDRYIASNTAKMACEGQARARGGSTICAVSCSVATKK